VKQRPISRRRAFAALVAALLTLAAACGDDDGDASSGSPTDPTSASTAETSAAPSTEPAAEPLRILVTNDDGVSSDGLDMFVEALLELPDVELTVVAPAENQSGAGDSQLAGAQPSSDTTTKSGQPAVAVEGKPADSVVWALDEGNLDEAPDLVVSGSNEGQNLGGIMPVSGTVGAARTAARRGIPAIAVSQGLGEPPDYEASISAAIDFLVEHREEIAALDVAEGDLAPVWSVNAPTCTEGEVRGVVEVPLDITNADTFADVDCTSTLEQPAHDVEAFLNGFVSITELEPAAIGLTDPAPS
jgi:5'-nucleotidase